MVPALPEVALKPMVKADVDAAQSSSMVVEPAVVPFTPTQKGVLGCREAIVPSLSDQNSFCLDPEPHGHP